jgi:hypothetical protein
MPMPALYRPCSSGMCRLSGYRNASLNSHHNPAIMSNFKGDYEEIVSRVSGAKCRNKVSLLFLSETVFLPQNTP